LDPTHIRHQRRRALTQIVGLPRSPKAENYNGSYKYENADADEQLENREHITTFLTFLGL
jgi:hypothetical protein